MKRVIRFYKLLLGFTFVLSLMIGLSGMSTVLTSVILLAFAILVFGGCCCLIGEFVVDCMNETDPAIMFGFLAIGLLAIIAWIAGLGILEILGSLFLWKVGESVLVWVAFATMVLWGGFYYSNR